jgi:hypothetical protein
VRRSADSWGLHTIVPQEAVGDGAELPHHANMFDIDAKYGDVVSVDETLSYLAKVGQRESAIV